MSNGSKHKMYDYEVTPPPGVWNRIAEALDETGTSPEYPALLYGMEVPPPAGTWSKIEAALDAEREIPVPAARRINPFLKYAAAAAVIAFLAWGAIRLINNNSSENNKDEIVKQDPAPVINAPVVPADEPGNTSPDIIVSNDAVKEEDARNEAALEESKKTYAKLTTPVRSKIKNAADFHFTLTEPVPSVDVDPATRYIVLMTPDGNIIRMSKKLGDLVCCVSGEEQDADCVDQLKKWREKLAGSSLAYSPGNFGDILNLVKALQE